MTVFLRTEKALKEEGEPAIPPHSIQPSRSLKASLGLLDPSILLWALVVSNSVLSSYCRYTTIVSNSAIFYSFLLQLRYWVVRYLLGHISVDLTNSIAFENEVLPGIFADSQGSTFSGFPLFSTPASHLAPIQTELGHKPTFTVTPKSPLAHKSISEQCSLYKKQCEGDKDDRGHTSPLTNNLKVLN